MDARGRPACTPGLTFAQGYLPGQHLDGHPRGRLSKGTEGPKWEVYGHCS